MTRRTDQNLVNRRIPASVLQVWIRIVIKQKPEHLQIPSSNSNVQTGVLMSLILAIDPLEARF